MSIFNILCTEKHQMKSGHNISIKQERKNFSTLKIEMKGSETVIFKKKEGI